jgi:hypothetical protein
MYVARYHDRIGGTMFDDAVEQPLARRRIAVPTVCPEPSVIRFRNRRLAVLGHQRLLRENVPLRL